MRLFAPLAISLAALTASAAADAAITVIGNTRARVCYEAARSAAKPASAIMQCDQALAGDPLSLDDEVATYVNRGILRAARGDVAGALGDYDAALARDANEPEAWLNKGFTFLRQGNAAGALPFFDNAVAKRTSEPAMAHYGRAIAHEQIGNVRAAYADFVRARDLQPRWDAPQTELRRYKVEPRPPR